jgi:hypothetical protein
MLKKWSFLLCVVVFSAYSAESPKHSDDSVSEERPSKKSSTEKSDRELKNTLENSLSTIPSTPGEKSESTSKDSSSSTPTNDSDSKSKSSKESKSWVDTGASKEVLKAFAEFDEFHNPELDHVGEMH